MPPAKPEKSLLKLSFIGAGFQNGAVPLTVVAAKLYALQLAMFHAAAAVSGRERERRGQWFNRYRASAELTFANSHHSDLVIEASLAASPVLSDDFNTGLEAVNILFNTAVAVEKDQLDNLQVGKFDRDYLLRALEGLAPNPGDQYEVKLENCRPAAHPAVTFTPEVRRRIRKYSARTLLYDFDEEVTIVGELVKIHVDTGEDKITVRYQRRDVDCHYPDAMRDQVSNLIAGSMVEVTGLATFSETNLIKGVRVVEVEHVSMEPIRIARFQHAASVYDLKSPVAVNVEYSDDMWIYHHEGLNLWGYGPRREDALRELHENFDYNWREIAEEKPERLDSVALQLREKLRSLVVNRVGVSRA